MMMHSKLKKLIIFLVQSPLILIGLPIRLGIALIMFIYLRWVLKGIHLGKILHNKLEAHELGYIKVKNDNQKILPILLFLIKTGLVLGSIYFIYLYLDLIIIHIKAGIEYLRNK